MVTSGGRSYIPVRGETSPSVCKFDDNPLEWQAVDRRPGVDQTSIATLIKQQEQLDVSQQTDDNSQDANSVFISNEEIIRKNI
jgi:hypothetical protein